MSNSVSTTNACKLCTPLGAALAFKGVEGGVPFLHGSQGCATYMRRYVISHFREPVDIASSSLGEKNAIYGGGPNLKAGILNVMKKYAPRLVGVASTCLTETIGDDVPMLLGEFAREFGADTEHGPALDLPFLVHVATPSYNGTHTDGFNGAVRAMAEQLCPHKVEPHGGLNLFCNLVSCEDIRILKDICETCGIQPTILPDYSDTLDGPALEDYERIPSGGTPVQDIQAMSGAAASVEFGRCLAKASAGTSLEKRFEVPNHRLGLPIGLRETDRFMSVLSSITGREMPRRLHMERGRLVDAFVDGHKYLYGKRAVVYGEEDLVTGLVSFLTEIGMHVVLAATGAKGKGLDSVIEEVVGDVTTQRPEVREGVDFQDIADQAEDLAPDLLVGHSKGYRYAREWGVPLLRVGFPIHDRFGGQRIPHLGYRGAQSLFDRIVNALLERKQTESSVGYGYM
jgi:nitrogenase molybdenum-iron protein NifN